MHFTVVEKSRKRRGSVIYQTFIFKDSAFLRQFKVMKRLRWLNTVLAVCEYVSFAKSWQEKGCTSRAET